MTYPVAAILWLGQWWWEHCLSAVHVQEQEQVRRSAGQKRGGLSKRSAAEAAGQTVFR